ncbi:uncharacterized protein MEPE_01801 [Melanopsichium pennsylvanicum]|uniref:DUF1275 domain protein n=2 Tax=Melanopsichium pennsylvanicum TaxID=63383 RepID=A0AAJ4XJ32_9BASI|nr:conserved hypothetical protein [Melanopsichium pennsylvanicum 4]SNX83095.1 uncharacterized protein MEPE_01801 [Melanopsichium pennsylvanicum]
MSSPAGYGENGDHGHADITQNERSPLLPHSIRRSKDGSISTSVVAKYTTFLKEHAFSPLPTFDSGDDLPPACVPPLLLQCIITGLADACTFTLTRTWIGFMTGNMVQMVINTFDLTLPSSSNTDGSTYQVRKKLESNIASLLGFVIGCQITSNIVKRLSTDRTKRLTFVLLSLYRSLATLFIIVVGVRSQEFRFNGSLGWLVISILAANLGCQSTYSTSLATPFSTTVVFTATLTAVSSDLHLPMLNLTGANRFRLLSIFGLLGGAAVSQLILKVATKASKQDKHEAVQHALIVLAAMEALLGLSWFLCGVVESWGRYRCRFSSEFPGRVEDDTLGVET